MSFLMELGWGPGPLGDRVEQCRDRSLEIGLRELDRVELVEGQPPDRQPRLVRGEQQPVQQPQRARVLHVGIPARPRRTAPGPSGWARTSPLAPGRCAGSSVISRGGRPPEADGPHHVLAHPDLHRGLGTAEDPAVVVDVGIGLAEPAVSGMERLMARERALGRLRPASSAGPRSPSIHGRNVAHGWDTLADDHEATGCAQRRRSSRGVLGCGTMKNYVNSRNDIRSFQFERADGRLRARSAGWYANLVHVWHTALEFTVEFAVSLPSGPDMPDAVCVAWMKVPPQGGVGLGEAAVRPRRGI